MKKAERFIRLMGSLTLLLCVSMNLLAQENEQTNRPNIILITSDHAGWGDFGFLGSKDIPTPNLDRLADQGVRFQNAYSASSSGPALACMMTGQYSSRFGFQTDTTDSDFIIGTAPTIGLKPNQVTVFDRLKANGYRTCYVGKWDLGHHRDNVQNGILFHAGNQPVRQGIDEFYGLLGGTRSYWAGEASGQESLIHQRVNGNSVIEQTLVEDQLAGQYVTDIFGDWSVDFIEKQSDTKRPYFLCCSFTSPQAPIQAKQQDLDEVDAMQRGLEGNRRTYAAMMLAMDRQIGRVVDAAGIQSSANDPTESIDPAQNSTPNTLVLFVNNSAGNCCEKASNASNNGSLRGGKGRAWEGSLRVPMVIAGSEVGNEMLGSVFEHPVHVVDVLPTIMAATRTSGGTHPPLDGVNLLPFIKGDFSRSPHEHIYLRCGPQQPVALRMGKWKLLHTAKTGFVLFDLDRNLGEDVEQDLVDQYPEVVQRMKQILTDYDVQMPRRRWGTANHCNEFRFRESLKRFMPWSGKDCWSDEKESSGVRTLMPEDGFADTGIVFRARQKGTFVSRNNMTRTGGLPFLANFIKFRSRDQAILSDSIAIIEGKPVLLTRSLEGKPASIRLESVSAQQHSVSFETRIELQLYSDLEITGDGSDLYRFSGGFTEFRPGINIHKTGSSVAILSGPSELSGTIEIVAGTLRIEHPDAIGDATVVVGPGSRFVSTVALSETTRSRISGPGEIVLAEPSNGHDANDYHLVWEEEFDVDGEPNPENWTFEHGFLRNHELQWYQTENAVCKNGKLIIEGQKERKPNPNYESGSPNWKKNREHTQYTSSCLLTKGLHSWQYGRFEIKARIKATEGLWPAIWLLGVDGIWPSCGEIDIMEFYKGNLLANACWEGNMRHVPTWDGSRKSIKSFGDPTWDEKFHVWRMDWDRESIKLYVDRILLNTIDLTKTTNAADRGPANPFHQPHYLLLNLAIGGDKGGDPTHTPFPTQYEIDYVRVFEKK